MNKINLIAAKWQRITAFIIDIVVIMLFIIIITTNHGGTVIDIVILAYFTDFLYYFTMKVIWDRTLGKLIMGIMVVDAERENYEEERMIKLIFVRTLCRYIPLNKISFFFTSNGQLWHDNISNTIVIRRLTRTESYFTGATKRN